MTVTMGSKWGRSGVKKGSLWGHFSPTLSHSKTTQLQQKEELMPNVKGTTRHQTIFLRAFRDHPAGPPPELWPSPAVFQRWLTRPHFRKTLQSTLAALRFQTDLHLAIAACQTARQIAFNSAAPNAPAPTPPDPNQLLRLHHLRQRFPAAGTPRKEDPEEPQPLSEREWVRSMSGDEGVKAYDELVAMRKARWAREKEEAKAKAQATANARPIAQTAPGSPADSQANTSDNILGLIPSHASQPEPAQSLTTTTPTPSIPPDSGYAQYPPGTGPILYP